LRNTALDHNKGELQIWAKGNLSYHKTKSHKPSVWRRVLNMFTSGATN